MFVASLPLQLRAAWLLIMPADAAVLKAP